MKNYLRINFHFKFAFQVGIRSLHVLSAFLTCNSNLHFKLAFQIGISVGTGSTWWGNQFPGHGGTGSPANPNLPDCKNPKGKPGWGKK